MTSQALQPSQLSFSRTSTKNESIVVSSLFRITDDHPINVTNDRVRKIVTAVIVPSFVNDRFNHPIAIFVLNRNLAGFNEWIGYDFWSGWRVIHILDPTKRCIVFTRFIRPEVSHRYKRCRPTRQPQSIPSVKWD